MLFNLQWITTLRQWRRQRKGAKEAHKSLLFIFAYLESWERNRQQMRAILWNHKFQGQPSTVTGSLRRMSKHRNKDKKDFFQWSAEELFFFLPGSPLAAANMTAELSGVNNQEKQFIWQESKHKDGKNRLLLRTMTKKRGTLQHIHL